MKLTLRIENVEALPDGGPLDYSATDSGFEVGRAPAPGGWKLPDPYVSARHMEIAWAQGAFVLTDVSSNGTYLYGRGGASRRVPSPYRLVQGDRLVVGPYVLRVQIEDVPAIRPAAHHAVPPTDWSGIALDGPTGLTDPPWDIPAAVPPPRAPVASLPLRPDRAASAGQATTISTASDQTVLSAICRGAGLPPGSLDGADPAALGEEIGQCLRIATEQLMDLLSGRAAAKQVFRTRRRTLVGAADNSPLKFMPDAAAALDTMFVTRKPQYLTATASFREGFDDLRRHQTAVAAALQPALARMLDDMTPEAIAARAAGGLVTSKKARAWETYVERWDAKAHPHENGMLDVFLACFAEAYEDALRQTGG
jgi:type VI secretion system protein ImpI